MLNMLIKPLDCISVNMFSTALVWKVGSTDTSLKILVKRTMLYAQFVGLDIKPMKSEFPTSESSSGACYDYYRMDHRNRMPAPLKRSLSNKTKKKYAMKPTDYLLT